ncbi:uncharacterized protein LOC107267158 [Cephus cinctus]|uniref:Uncharacterized protein LOC107267158 n=1 Tax=Cephus cinctus TaxID=211228 RepID=A0AAJ7BUE1_CEPCN|nr:uncharacterized protein LOC107267158 [Cephus cinctus]
MRIFVGIFLFSLFCSCSATVDDLLPGIISFGNEIVTGFNKGIATIRQYALGPPGPEKQYIEFRPDDGPRASFEYQRRYGRRGERLIEMLGSGVFTQPPVHFQQNAPLRHQ